jgi:hypothetical protein
MLTEDKRMSCAGKLKTYLLNLQAPGDGQRFRETQEVHLVCLLYLISDLAKRDQYLALSGVAFRTITHFGFLSCF